MKRLRKRPGSAETTYEPVTITPEQAIARLHRECPELAALPAYDERDGETLQIGLVKGMLAALIDTGSIKRVKAVMGLVETLVREGDARLRNALAVGLLEHLPELGARRLEVIQQAMGPASRHLYDDVLAYNEALRTSRRTG